MLPHIEGANERLSIWRHGSICSFPVQLEKVKLSQVEADRQAENDRDAKEALWQKLQEANQRLSDVSRDTLGREAEREQRIGMAEYGQQMAEAQCSGMHAELQQRGSMLQVTASPSKLYALMTLLGLDPCQGKSMHT